MNATFAPLRRPRIRCGLVVATGLLAVVLAGCGSRDADPATQPAPGVTTFEEGRFDNLPQYPRSEPLGPRTEKRGVVARSYKAPGASPEQVLDFYRDALAARWSMVSPVEKLGVGTFGADWVGEDFRLRVTATREGDVLSQDDASRTVAAQYSLTLHPL